MDVNEYITFSQNDIIEALEDYYEKKTNEKMSISFDEKNMNGLAPLRSITVSKTISSRKAKFAPYGPEDTIKMEYENSLSAKGISSISSISSNKNWSGITTTTGTKKQNSLLP